MGDGILSPHQDPAGRLEHERELRLDEALEEKLLAAAANCGWRASSLQPFEDIVKLMGDTGMRNQGELYRLRIENIDWQTRSVFIPDSKTPEGRRTVPMSQRVFEILRRHCRDKRGNELHEGWVFPAPRKRTKVPYLGSIAKHFAEARKKSGLPKNLVLYCGRHDFGTVVTARTGNLKAVMKVMGPQRRKDRDESINTPKLILFALVSIPTRAMSAVDISFSSVSSSGSL